MVATKSKFGLSETPTKVLPVTPRVATKLSRALVKTKPGSPSPMQGTRHWVDRSL
ncbi:hypothetical protein J1N35_043782 [Gossypium stocksii]|uniref:Uncharacterized protein n=1 Tax=Gossypium stocksii TaxID=47602 RepID=A0A9D3U8B3_9ROSI|nr:hypothetical protein J1N35_043782 [Gossypium stocksii]